MYGMEAVEERRLSSELACDFENLQNEDFSNTYIPGSFEQRLYGAWDRRIRELTVFSPVSVIA